MKRIHFSDFLQQPNRLGGVLIHPTNSCYGFAARIDDSVAYKRIYEIKGRPSDKPFFITVSSRENAEKNAIYDERIDDYFLKYPETIFTFILKRSTQLPSYINPNFETVGIQFAKGNLAIICEELGGAMFGTSANISGQAAFYDAQHIIKQFKQFSDITFLDAGDLIFQPASTIIDLTKSTQKILRGTLK